MTSSAEGRNSDRERASAWARSLLLRSDWVVLDTETTGLDGDDEIIQIAAIAPDGTAVIDELIRPTKPIPAEATAIHGIRDEDVEAAPRFPEVFDRLRAAVEGKTIVIFNAAFDLRMFRQSLARHRLPALAVDAFRAECAMLKYSAWRGERWPGGGYKWQRLPEGDHSAKGDSLAVLRLIRRMAAD
jgi:DNA polymerase III subunit epsilon